MDERRFYSRVKTDERVTCRINKESEAVHPDSLTVTDLSPAGLCFISGEEISKDTVLKLQMSFPSVYSLDPELYNSVKVAHCDKDINTHKFKIGGYYIRPNKRGFYGR
jgi:hypothetical protein